MCYFTKPAILGFAELLQAKGGKVRRRCHMWHLTKPASVLQDGGSLTC